MGTSALKDKAVAARHAFRHAFASASALPAPYQLAIEDTPFRLTVLAGEPGRDAAEWPSGAVDDAGACDHDPDAPIEAGTWFAVAPRAATKKRYLYLVQKASDTGIVALLLAFDRGAQRDPELRLPPSKSWMRAGVDGELYVLASDLVLTCKSIAAWIGGYEPPAYA